MDTPQVIEPGRLYTEQEAMRRLGVQAWAWRKMRRAGLRTVRQGRVVYAFGDDVLDYFERLREAASST